MSAVTDHVSQHLEVVEDDGMIWQVRWSRLGGSTLCHFVARHRGGRGAISVADSEAQTLDGSGFRGVLRARIMYECEEMRRQQWPAPSVSAVDAMVAWWPAWWKHDVGRD